MLNEQVIIKKREKESREKTGTAITDVLFTLFTLYHTCVLPYTLEYRTSQRIFYTGIFLKYIHAYIMHGYEADKMVNL